MSDDTELPDGPTKVDVPLPAGDDAVADKTPRQQGRPNAVPRHASALSVELTEKRPRIDTHLDEELTTVMPPGDDPALLAELTEDLAAMGFSQRYARVGRVGEGGMGEVGLFEDGQIGRQVAVKTMHEGHRSDRATRARFLREARVQAQLEHPSIVPVYDMGVDEAGREYFTMKRVRGHSLEEILDDLRDNDEDRKHQYSKRRLLAAFSNVCLAVDFAHRRGILHRDLKPGNIMLGDFGEVYVLDWGLARVSDAEQLTNEMPRLMPQTAPRTAVGAMLGTPGYMAPEQMRGQHSALGPTADIYSLGAILFEICTLEELHPRASIDDVFRSTLNGVEARPSVRSPALRVAIELEEIVVRAVAQNPKDRFPTARAMNEALERHLDGERDEGLRHDLSREHAARARDLGTRTMSSLDDRRVAMRELGRSLALDPENHSAREILMSILATPPPVLPAEVVHSIRNAEEGRTRRTGMLSAITYGSLVLYVPLLAWLGVRNGASLIPFVILSILSAAGATYVWRLRPTETNVLVVMFLSTLAMAATASILGPLLVTPMLIAVNTGAYALLLQGVQRLVTVVTGIGVLLASTALGLFGVLPGGYVFDNGAMHILEGAVSFPEVPTIVFLAIASVSTVITSAVLPGLLRDDLAKLERQLFLYSWHLRELVPSRAREPTEPISVKRDGSR